MSGFALSKLSPTPMQDKTGFNGAHHHEVNMGSFLNLSIGHTRTRRINTLFICPASHSMYCQFVTTYTCHTLTHSWRWLSHPHDMGLRSHDLNVSRDIWPGNQEPCSRNETCTHKQPSTMFENLLVSIQLPLEFGTVSDWQSCYVWIFKCNEMY